jgi:hypothetical protein
MSPSLATYDAGAPIFIDANVFLFHAFDDDRFGEIATAFLARVENQEIEALTSSLVIDEVPTMPICRTFQTSSSGHRSDPRVVPAPSQNFSP